MIGEQAARTDRLFRRGEGALRAEAGEEQSKGGLVSREVKDSSPRREIIKEEKRKGRGGKNIYLHSGGKGGAYLEQRGIKIGKGERALYSKKEKGSLKVSSGGEDNCKGLQRKREGGFLIPQSVRRGESPLPGKGKGH